MINNAKIFAQQLEAQVSKSPQWKKEVKRKVNEQLKDIRKDMLETFSKHPITQELKLGPTAKGSNYLRGVDGNLFGFIGFYNSEQPIKNLMQTLQEIKVSYSFAGGNTKVKIIVPSKEDIFDQTPLPWATGRSWAKAMETGLAGLGHYLNSYTFGSRSKAGVQVKPKLRGGKFKNTSYLSPILKKYYKSIAKLENQFT